MPAVRQGAAAVVIGNEVLSAKVEEQNGALLIRRLRERGVPLRWMAVVPDEIDAIVEAVAHARSVARYVFTSGGIGPTHDDVTVRAVALALGRRVVRMPEVEAMVREHYGASPPAEALRLADAPHGARLLRQEGVWFPVLECEGVFIIHGVPQLFRIQLEAALAHVEGQPIQLHSLYLGVGEAEIAQVLDRVALENAEVAIGSYPTFDRSLDYKVKLTVEHAQADTVARVVERLRRELPQGSLLREE
jgi:molybdenum cofactor synthesis domain-containing protein